jgi:hypothetical protein
MGGRVDTDGQASDKGSLEFTVEIQMTGITIFSTSLCVRKFSQ